MLKAADNLFSPVSQYKKRPFPKNQQLLVMFLGYNVNLLPNVFIKQEGIKQT